MFRFTDCREPNSRVPFKRKKDRGGHILYNKRTEKKRKPPTVRMKNKGEVTPRRKLHGGNKPKKQKKE